MTYRDLFEIGFSYIQYLLLLIQISPTSFPSYYNAPFNALRYLNLDLVNVFSERARYSNAFNWRIPLWVPLDFRLQFTLVSVCIPLFASMIGMYSLAQKSFFLWYFLLLAAMFILVIAVLLNVHQHLFTQFTESDRWWLLYIGACSSSVLAIAGVMAFFYNRITDQAISEADMHEIQRTCGGLEKAMQAEAAVERVETIEAFHAGDDEGQTNENILQIFEKETQRIDVASAVERTLYTVVCLFFGLAFVGLFSGWIPAFERFNGSSVAFYLGLTLLAFSLLFLVWLLIGFSRKGRLKQFLVQVYARDHFVSIQLLLVSLLYTPAVKNVVVMFNCQSISCEAGTRFPFGQSLFDDINTGKLCEPCNFTRYNQTCPLALQDQFCGHPLTAQRLVADTGIVCTNVAAYFWPAASIMLVSFVLSVPILNIVLTGISARILEVEYPVDSRQCEGYTEDERWYEKVTLSENVGKFIYAPFLRKFKHWKMFFLFQKLAIVVVSTTARAGTGGAAAWQGIGLSLGIHGIFCIYIIFVLPFQRKVENIFFACCQLMLSVVCALGLASTLEKEAPDGVLLTAAVCVFLVPVLSLIVGEVLTFKDEIEHDEARDERVRIAEQHAEHQDGDLVQMHLTTSTDNNDDTLDAFFDEAHAIQSTSSTMLRSQAALGNMALAHRFHKMAKATTHDFSGKPTLLEQIRQQDKDTQTSLKNKSLMNLLHQDVPESSTDGSFVDVLAMPAFGAAQKNLRGTHGLFTVRNTMEQSVRAKFLWMRAKTGIKKKIKEGVLNRKGSLYAGPNAVPSKKTGAGWGKLLEQLLDEVRKDKDKEVDEMSQPTRKTKTEPGKSKRNRGGVQFIEMDNSMSGGRSGGGGKSGGGNTLMKEGSGDIDDAAFDEVSIVHGAAAARRQHMQVRFKLKNIYDQQLVKLQLTQQAVDFKINKKTIKAVNIFFVLSGLLSMLAMAFSLVGFFDSIDENFIGAFDYNADLSVESQFAGYANWTDFTSNCCCLASLSQKPKIPYYAIDLEGWLCANNKYRERIRTAIINKVVVGVNGRPSGDGVRDICGTSFNNGCFPTIDPTTRLITLTGCNASAVDTAGRRLW